MTRLARIAGVAIALLVCAWFGLGVREAHEINQVTAAVGSLTGQQRLSAAQATRADGLLGSAGVLNPDRTVELLRARVALLSGDRPSAKRILLAVVREEPMNLDAWYGLATSALDGPTINLALTRIAQLQPPLKRTH